MIKSDDVTIAMAEDLEWNEQTC